MASGEPSRKTKRVKQTGQRPLDTSRPTTRDFERIHFPFPYLAKRFHTSFMDKTVTSFYFADINDFANITVCGSTIRDILVQWEGALSVEERVCENLVWMFYSNMELFAIRKDRVVTHVSGVQIEFDAFELRSYNWDI